MRNNRVRRLAAAATGLAALAALFSGPAAAAAQKDGKTENGKTEAAAAASWSRISLSRIYAWDLEEDGWLSDGDELYAQVVTSGGGVVPIWGAGPFKVRKGQTCITFGHVCDLTGTNYTTGLDGGSTMVQDFAVGEELTIQLWEDDVVEPDLLVEARITVDGANQTFFGHSRADASFAYMLYGTLTPIG